MDSAPVPPSEMVARASARMATSTSARFRLEQEQSGIGLTQVVEGSFDDRRKTTSIRMTINFGDDRSASPETTQDPVAEAVFDTPTELRYVGKDLYLQGGYGIGLLRVLAPEVDASAAAREWLKMDTDRLADRLGDSLPSRRSIGFNPLFYADALRPLFEAQGDEELRGTTTTHLLAMVSIADLRAAASTLPANEVSSSLADSFDDTSLDADGMDQIRFITIELWIDGQDQVHKERFAMDGAKLADGLVPPASGPDAANRSGSLGRALVEMTVSFSMVNEIYDVDKSIEPTSAPAKSRDITEAALAMPVTTTTTRAR